LKPEQVQLHTTFLGGGFGRRATPTNDFVSEAVHVAKASGMPVKVVWTREDDMRGGYYRPMWAHRLSAGLGPDGMPAAGASRSWGSRSWRARPSRDDREGVDETSVEGVHDSPYVEATPHHFVGLHSTKNTVPVLWWRSVGHTHTAFVMETFVNELAAAGGQTPADYRRRLYDAAKSPRHRGVLDLALQKAGAAPAARPVSRFAVHHSFESYVAEVADVSVESGRIRVHRVVAAIDCGICINPAGVRAQIESGIVFGLSAALYGEIGIQDGRVRQSNFHDYPILRMNEMPKIEVHIVDSAEKSGGVGEPGTPPIAPAVANAVFGATGKRLRSLPLRLA
jgi:isoquinoline 1-oxidoreductase beta subunit